MKVAFVIYKKPVQVEIHPLDLMLPAAHMGRPLPKRSKSKETNLVSVIAAEAAYDWGTIQKLAKQHNVPVPSRHWYTFVRALCSNKKFVEEIREARKQCGIKEELFIEEDRFDEFPIRSYFESPQQNKPLDKKITKLAASIRRRYRLTQVQRINLEYLIRYGVFEANPKSKDIRFEVIDGEVHIIVSKPLPRYKIREEIENDSVELVKMLKEVRDEIPALKISDRDFEIVRLRNERGLSWDDVVEKVSQKFSMNDAAAKFNLSSARMAHIRAMKKINALFAQKSAPVI